MPIVPGAPRLSRVAPQPVSRKQSAKIANADRSVWFVKAILMKRLWQKLNNSQGQFLLAARFDDSDFAAQCFTESQIHCKYDSLPPTMGVTIISGSS